MAILISQFTQMCSLKLIPTLKRLFEDYYFSDNYSEKYNSDPSQLSEIRQIHYYNFYLRHTFKVI